MIKKFLSGFLLFFITFVSIFLFAILLLFLMFTLPIYNLVDYILYEDYISKITLKFGKKIDK